jgi:hypothetical protein
MRPFIWALLLAAFAVAVPVRAADLTKIDRTIAKEPAYKNKPQYVLLVFGAEVKFRVWLVRDGDALYVDRNGNGDLTDDKKRLTLAGQKLRAGDLGAPDGQTRYTDLVIESYENPQNKAVYWTINVKGKYPYRAFCDAQGDLVSAARPQDAPVIHFDGPLSIEPFDYCMRKPTQLLRRQRPSELRACFGTPGLGKGTFAYLLPAEKDKVELQAEVEFPRRDGAEKAKPIKLNLTRDPDCIAFAGEIEVPEAAVGGKARVTFSAPDWKGNKVAPVTCDVPVVAPKPRR